MRAWIGLAGCLISGCFNPDGAPVGATDTDASTSAPTSGSMSGSSASMTGPTSSSETENTSTPATETDMTAETTATTGGGIPDWGEGEPPDFGDLGPEGAGNVLVVHALDFDGAVDVWLVGEASPAATDLAPEDALLLEGIDREARRLVLAEAGTLNAVGCSEWFPLRADEQWASVSARDSHGCPDADGQSITFQQELSLSGNPVRVVHAAAPDDLTVTRGGVPEAGTLAPLSTLGISDLPDCSASGCTLPYGLENADLALGRNYTFLANQVGDLPPTGEVLLVAVGNIRQEWPREADALRMLRVDIDGTARPMGRNPEVAFFGIQSGAAASFSVLAPPAMVEIALAPECPFDSCTAPVVEFVPATREIFGETATAPQVSGEFNLLADRRYLLVFTAIDGPALTFIEVDFDRNDAGIAVGRGFNAEGLETLTLARLFGGSAQLFDEFQDIPSLATTNEQELPVDNWDLSSALGGGTPGTQCFRSVTTPAAWRGMVSASFMIELDTWPPQETRLELLCF